MKESKKKKQEKIIEEPVDEDEVEVNPDDFEDINGFELMVYKKNYYLRDLETNEVYDILDKQPNKVVGFITSKGRMKFN